MVTSRHRAASLAIWGLLGAFALLQGAAWSMGSTPRFPWGVAQVVLAWTIMLVLALVSTRRIDRLASELTATEHAHRAVQEDVDQLQLHNAVLDTLARSVDVPLAFQSLAPRLAQLVPCDRLGLALLSEDGDEFQTYTVRMDEKERRSRPRPDVVFKAEGSAIGHAVRSKTPLIIDDTSVGAHEFLDTNVVHTSGFASAALVPLIFNERGVGTLNVVSRRPAAFTQEDVDALLPVTGILAMAYVAQQLHAAVTRRRTMESVTEATLGVSTEISAALQTITGQCDLIERTHPDPTLQREVATIERQAQRIAALLDKMRSASQDRLSRAVEAVKAGGSD